MPATSGVEQAAAACEVGSPLVGGDRRDERGEEAHRFGRRSHVDHRERQRAPRRPERDDVGDSGRSVRGPHRRVSRLGGGDDGDGVVDRRECGEHTRRRADLPADPVRVAARELRRCPVGEHDEPVARFRSRRTNASGGRPAVSRRTIRSAGAPADHGWSPDRDADDRRRAPPEQPGRSRASARPSCMTPSSRRDIDSGGVARGRDDAAVGAVPACNERSNPAVRSSRPRMRHARGTSVGRLRLHGTRERAPTRAAPARCAHSGSSSSIPVGGAPARRARPRPRAQALRNRRGDRAARGRAAFHPRRGAPSRRCSR